MNFVIKTASLALTSARFVPKPSRIAFKSLMKLGMDFLNFDINASEIDSIPFAIFSKFSAAFSFISKLSINSFILSTIKGIFSAKYYTAFCIKSCFLSHSSNLYIMSPMAAVASITVYPNPLNIEDIMVRAILKPPPNNLPTISITANKPLNVRFSFSAVLSLIINCDVNLCNAAISLNNLVLYF